MRLTGSLEATLDHYGACVSIDGHTMVVGAADSDVGGSAAGRVYVYVKVTSGWRQQAVLYASDPAANDRFGCAVELKGNTLAVGARGHATALGGASGGAVYIFTRVGVTWTQTAILEAASVTSGRLGSSVALDGDTLVAGAYLTDIDATDTGSAYVFVRAEGVWSQQAQLLPDVAELSSQFGHAVAISGDTIVVGRYAKDGGASTSAGDAFVYVRDGVTWSQQAHLLPTTVDGGFFGDALAIDGNTIVVGAVREDTVQGTDFGAVYVFVRDGITWDLEERIIPVPLAAVGATADFFGSSIALRGDLMAIGASGGGLSGGAGDRGVVYIYTRSGGVWTQRTFFNGEATIFDGFAASSERSVSLSDTNLAVGANWETTASGVQSGAAYIFPIDQYL